MGKGSKKVTVGYKYFLGAQLSLCHGAVDAVRRIIIGEREASTTVVNYGTASLAINKPDLFGGIKREGGVVGTLEFLWGDASQARNSYLSTFQGASCPAYRGTFGVVFKSFMWSAMNPYFKAPWIEVSRILKGWRNDTVWNSSYATINTYDMNPAHIIYQCLTDVEWGMGYNAQDIDDTSFSAAASKLLQEGFGLSLLWEDQSNIEDFIKEIINHIDGTLRLDMSTGKFVLKLNRDDYTIGTLTGLTTSNVIELKSFQRASYGEFANEIVVTYTDRDQVEKTVAVQNLASVESQGTVISTSRTFRGIRDSTLAAKVAMRELRMTSTPLAKVTMTTNRVLYNKEVGDVVKVTWPDLGLSELPMRVIKIDKGSLADGKIEVDLIEDIFSLPSSSYTSAPPSSWTDTAALPVQAEAWQIVEAPYWEIALNMTRADIDYLQPQYGFGLTLATRGVNNFPYSYDLYNSPNASTFTLVGTSNFVPTGKLSADITRTQTTFTLTDFYDLDQAMLDAENGYLIIDSEYMAVTSVNASTGVVVVRRGVLDTVPVTHVAMSRAWFAGDDYAFDKTEHVSGETTYYKVCPSTALGTLDVGATSYASKTFANRASRPYPPGQFKVNASYWPANINGALTVTWVGRDRLQQTVSLIDYTQGNVGPEAGTTYTLRVYNASTGTLKRIYTTAVSPWTYPAADDQADGYLSSLRITVASSVGGVESLYQQENTFGRYGLGFRLGESLGGAIPA